MNSNRAVLLVGVTLLLLFAFSIQSTHSADTDGVRRWEHLAMTVGAASVPGDAETSRQIVKLGDQGWELVDVENISKEGTTTNLVYFFKRPK